MKYLAALCILFLTLNIVPTFAQERSISPLAAIRNHNVWLYGFGDEPYQITDGKSSNYSNLVWSSNGDYLAFFALDENFKADLWLYNRTNISLKQIESNVVAGFPVSFSNDNNQLIFTKDNTPPGSSSNNPIDIYTYDLVTNTTPAKVATIEGGEGCGGGSSFPADWRYWDETGGLGGFHSILEMTPFGLVYSLDCATRTALLNLETGESSLLGDFGRAVISADRTKVAGITDLSGNTANEKLMVADLQTHQIAQLETTGVPDQIVWGASGSTELFYSTRQMTDRVIPTSSEAIDRINTVLGTSGQIHVWEVSIHQVNVAKATDVERYRADAYAIGRMSAVSEAAGLVFSQISNAEVLLEEIASGRLDQSDPDRFAASVELVPVQLFSLALNQGQAQMLSTDLYEVALLPIP